MKVNGYTNIQTYRLCLVLDNEEFFTNCVVTIFFNLVKQGEFEEKDFEDINWSEVFERYSNHIRSYHLRSYHLPN